MPEAFALGHPNRVIAVKCYETFRTGPACVVRLTGEVDAAVCPGLRAHLHQLAAGQLREIEVDCEGLLFADVSLAHALAEAARVLEQSGGHIRVSRCQPPVAKLLRLSGLGALVCPSPASRAGSGS